MAPDLISTTFELNLPKKRHLLDDLPPFKPSTPSEWFALKFPEQIERFGSPFLEVRQSTCDGISLITPVHINVDFFAAMLGGDLRLGHSVIYFEPELQFYYREPMLQLYKITTPEKLQTYYRALILRCLQDMTCDVSKINMFAEFRSDKTARAVVQRAKSILAAGPDFFSATSPHQRIKGAELYERLARVFVESMLEKRDGANLTVTQAYNLFLKLAQQRNLEAIPRITFKELLRDLINEKYGVCVRRDVLNENQKQQEGWKWVVALTV